LKLIEEIKVGENVLSRNERTGQPSYEPVPELIQHDGTFQLVKVTLDSGESLEATAGHPFYIQGKGWNAAANLKVGDALQLYNGITVVVKTVDTSTREGRVYNFAVAQNANYFVGKDGVLVHNSGGCPGLKGDPYHPDSVADRIKPPYRPNPAHNKKSSSYNPRKTPESDDADSVYQNATRKDNMGTWYGKNDKGQTYKYYYDNAGGAHFIGIE
jgi:intein/homing endonuclease